MKDTLRKLLKPILNRFETGDEAFVYKASHRLILKVVGVLFLVLAGLSVLTGVIAAQMAALLPAVVFSVASLICLVVGFLGSDQAVARIWKSR